jgi:hypothetical protein
MQHSTSSLFANTSSSSSSAAPPLRTPTLSHSCLHGAPGSNIPCSGGSSGPNPRRLPHLSSATAGSQNEIPGRGHSLSLAIPPPDGSNKGVEGVVCQKTCITEIPVVRLGQWSESAGATAAATPSNQRRHYHINNASVQRPDQVLQCNAMCCTRLEC